MCVTEGNFTQMCQKHADEQIAAFYAKFPGVEQFHIENKGRCLHCIELDTDDTFGPGAGAEWRHVEWLLP
jgi:hypothetical protein